MKPFFLISLTLALIGLWPVSAQATTQATLVLTSSPGEPVCQGVSKTLVSTDSNAVYRNFQGGIGATFGSQDWLQFDVAGPESSGALAVGYYADAARFPNQGSHPGLSVSSYLFDNRRSVVTGEFTVAAVAYDASGRLTDLDLTFIQSCDGGPALSGHLTFRRFDETPARPQSWGQLKSLYR